MRWFCLKTNLQNAHKITRLYSLCADWVPCVFSSNFCWFDTAIYKWLCNELQTKFECRQKQREKWKEKLLIEQYDNAKLTEIGTFLQWNRLHQQMTFSTVTKKRFLFHIKYLPQNLAVHTVCAFMKWNHIERQTSIFFLCEMNMIGSAFLVRDFSWIFFSFQYTHRFLWHQVKIIRSGAILVVPYRCEYYSKQKLNVDISTVEWALCVLCSSVQSVVVQTNT